MLKDMLKKSVICLLMLCASPITAQDVTKQDVTKVFSLQKALKDHDFYSEKLDGRLGPATRRALREFAEKYAIESDAQSVIRFMMQQSVKFRTEITDEESLEVIRLEVAEGLRDPDSAKIRNVYKVDGGVSELVCGEVNGRNAYGGYAGFTPFYGSLIESIGFFILYGIEDPDDTFIAYKCALTFPPQP